jgi:hypothetical protein
MKGSNLKYFVLGAALVAAGLGALAVNIPHSFSSGQVISAAQLTANFAAVKTAVDTLETKVAALEGPTGRSSAGSRTLTLGNTTSTGPAELGRFSVTLPGPGRLIVRVSGLAFINVDSGTTSSITESFGVGLCDATAVSTVASCEGSYNTYFMSDPDNASFSDVNRTFVLERTVNITAAGSRTFFVNGQTSVAIYELRISGNPRANLLFIPAANDLTISQP